MVQGIIERITSKEVNTKFGKKPVYSLLVNGEWYGNVWKKPTYSEGDEVEFKEQSRNVNGTTYYSVDGVVTIVSRGAGTSSNTSSQTQTKKTSTGKRFNCTCDQFPINPLDRQMSIIIQSSINRAVELILAQFVTLTDAQKKKYDVDAMWKDVSALTDKIASKASGQDLIEEVLKEKATKYKEYQKLLQGDLDLDDSESSDHALQGCNLRF